jgi:hypothetical protein
MDKATLEQQHPDHAALRSVWDHAIDAWDGVGGYMPWLDNTGNGAFGAISSYAGRPPRSYIDQHPRESAQKYARRVRGAVYTNVSRSVGETILGFLLRRPPSRDGGSDAVRRFLADADGHGTPWQDMLRRRIAPRTLLFGTCPILVDRPQVTGRSRADTESAGASTYCVPLYPQTLCDWETDDDGIFEQAKLLDERTHADAKWQRAIEKQARVWTRGTWQVWTLQDAAGSMPRLIEEGEHPLGVVPLVLASFSDSMRASILGTTFMSTVIEVGRKLYNYQSELDDHLRNQVFAIVCIPTDGDPGAVKLGTDNGMRCAVVGNMPAILAPPASVAETMFHALDRMRDEAYAAAKLGFALATKQQPESGLARSYEFQATSRQINAFAASMRRAEMDVLRLVCLWEGEDPAVTLADYKCEWPDDYDVRDLDAEIKRAIDVLTLPIQRTAMSVYLRTLRDDLVELDAEQRATSDEEIDAALAESEIVPVQQNEPPESGPEQPPAPMPPGETPAAV